MAYKYFPDLENNVDDADVKQIEDAFNQIENDITALQNKKETDPTVPSWAKEPQKPTYTADEVGALPSDTKIPTKISDLENDLTELQDVIADVGDLNNLSTDDKSNIVNAINEEIAEREEADKSIRRTINNIVSDCFLIDNIGDYVTVEGMREDPLFGEKYPVDVTLSGEFEAIYNGLIYNITEPQTIHMTGEDDFHVCLKMKSNSVELTTFIESNDAYNFSEGFYLGHVRFYDVENQILTQEPIFYPNELLNYVTETSTPSMTDKSLLSLIRKQINEESLLRQEADSEFALNMGNVEELQTSNKSSLVNAINEVKDLASQSGGNDDLDNYYNKTEIDDKFNFQQNLIDAEINARDEADAIMNDEIMSIQTNIGVLNNLTTSNKSNIVNAINALKDEVNESNTTLASSLKWTLIGETALTQEDIDAAGEAGITALTIGNSANFILDGYRDVLVVVYAPKYNVNTETRSVRLGFGATKANALTVGQYEFIKAHSINHVPLYFDKNNRIKILINFDENGKQNFSQCYFNTNAIPGYATTVYGTATSVECPTTSEGKYLSVNSGIYQKPFYFGAGSYMKVYGRGKI